MPLPRMLPRADLLVQQLLQQLMSPHLPEVQIGTQKTNVFNRLPFVFVEEIPGGSEPHPELLAVAAVGLEVFARGSKAAAADVAELARVSLWRAVDKQLVVAAGHLTSYRCDARPVEQRDAGQPADVYQYAGAWSLGVRLN